MATGGTVLGLVEQRPGLPIVRLRSRREVRRWLAGPLQGARADAAGL